MGDVSLKVLLYHVPQNSGVPNPLPLIERLVTAYPDTVIDTKDSAGDFCNMEAIIRYFPYFRVFFGSDAYLMDILRIGGAGSIIACNKFATVESAAVYAGWQAAGTDGLEDALCCPSGHAEIPAD